MSSISASSNIVSPSHRSQCKFPVGKVIFRKQHSPGKCLEAREAITVIKLISFCSSGKREQQDPGKALFW